MSDEQLELALLVADAASHIQLGEFAGANRLLRDALPKNLHPALARGLELWRGNRPRLAFGAIRDYLQQNPNDLLALQVGGHISAQLGAIDEAIRLLSQCLENLLVVPPLNYELCNLLARRQRYPEALEQVGLLLDDDPENRQFRMLKAALLDRSGQYPPAMAILQDVIAQDTASNRQTAEETANVWTALGMMQRTCGDSEAAIHSLRQAVKADPSSGWPWFQLSDFKVYEFTAAEMESIEAGLRNSKPGSMNEVHFCFALGRAHESQGNIDAAFSAYLRGNRVRAAMAPFDMAACQREFDTIRKVFSPELLARAAPIENSNCPAVFVVGLPRSGTTLVDQIITAHSLVDGTMELPLIGTLIREFQQRQLSSGGAAYPAGIAQLPPQELQQMGKEYLARAEIQRGQAPLFVDKMPFNFQHIGLIHMILPGARVIHVRRNPMATGFSVFRQLFRFGQDWTFDLETIARYYRAYDQLMQHWNEALPGFVTTVQYEDLVLTPDVTISQLLEQLDLPDEAACHKPHENPRPVRTASSEQVRQAMYTDAVTYWRRYEKQLEPMRLILEESRLESAPN